MTPIEIILALIFGAFLYSMMSKFPIFDTAQDAEKIAEAWNEMKAKRNSR